MISITYKPYIITIKSPYWDETPKRSVAIFRDFLVWHDYRFPGPLPPDWYYHNRSRCSVFDAGSFSGVTKMTLFPKLIFLLFPQSSFHNLLKFDGMPRTNSYSSRPQIRL